MTAQPTTPKRNPIARDLRTPKYRLRIIKSKKTYNRKRPTNRTEGTRT
jgi:hypothetical protein